MLEDENDQLQETAPGEGTEEQGSQGGLSQDAEGTIQAEQAAPTEEQAQATFLEGANLDPRKLPPEIQPIFKKMQGAYTKRMQEAAEWRRQAELVGRFQNDRDFAFNTVAQWATQNGYSIAPVGAQQSVQAQPRRQGAPSAALVESIKANLPPELQWMAESTAPAIATAVQELLAPLAQQLTQQQAQTQRSSMEHEWDTLAGELSDVAPGWEEHEPQMVELLDFLQGSSMRHPQFGSKHQLLYNLVTGNAAATAQVTKRMNAAAKNRPASGIVTSRTTSNLTDRIRSAKTSQDAFRLAAQAAEQQAG